MRNDVYKSSKIIKGIHFNSKREKVEYPMNAYKKVGSISGIDKINSDNVMFGSKRNRLSYKNTNDSNLYIINSSLSRNDINTSKGDLIINNK